MSVYIVVLLIGCIAVLCAVGNVTATTEMPGGTTAGDMNEGPHVCLSNMFTLYQLILA